MLKSESFLPLNIEIFYEGNDKSSNQHDQEKICINFTKKHGLFKI